MIQIEHEQNIEILRQVALLLDREVRVLIERIKALSLELSRLRGQDASKVQHELEILQDLLARREQALLEAASAPPPQTETQPEAKEPRPRRGHGPREQPELPIETQVHELPETERDCPVCGGDLTPMQGQFEEADEISVVERRFVVVKHQRQKYRCKCNASLVTAPGPPKLQPGGHYSPEFAVEVATAKFLDHQPLERQVRIMQREGLRIDSQTLWDQTELLARHHEPNYEALGRRVLESELVHADETSWWMLGKPPERWCVWGTAGRDAVCYHILDSRSKQAAWKVLGNYEGIVMADGYPGYEASDRAPFRFQLVNCWAHVRRKFADLATDYPRESREILDRIRELYAIEREVPAVDARSTPEQLAEAQRLRLQLRQERSQEVLDRIHAWALAQMALPRSGLGQAISYMLERWEGLTAFVKDARIPLDNNAAERALRGVALGRKNHYGSRSQRGAHVAAIFYSLFESAKLCGVEPKSYLLKASLAAIAKPGTVTLPSSLIG